MIRIALQKKDILAAEVVNTCVETHHNIPRLEFFNVDRDIYLHLIHARNLAMKYTDSERSHHHFVWTPNCLSSKFFNPSIIIIYQI